MIAVPIGDQELADAVLRDRSERAFRELYRRHTPALYRLALGRSGDSVLAEELVQDAWIGAVRGLPGFRWQSSLRTWLVGILLNCSRGRARTARCQPASVPEEIGAEDWGPDRLAARIDVDQAISALADGYRVVLLLHDLEGYTHEEIARLLGIEVGTSKSQLSRARAEARRLLEPESIEPPATPADP